MNRRLPLLQRDRLAPGPDDQSALTLVVAPAGAGKSTLLQQWQKSGALRGQGVCWLRLDSSYDVPGTFWAGVCAVLQAEVGEDEGAQQPGSLAEAKRLVASLEKPTLLVIDDYHHVSSSRTDLDLVELLRLSPHLNLAVLSRRVCALDGPLVFGGFPMRLIGSEDLAFTQEEMEELARLRDVPVELLPSRTLEITRGSPQLIGAVLAGVAQDPQQPWLRATLAETVRQQLEACENPAVREVFQAVVLCEGIRPAVINRRSRFSAVQIDQALEQLEDLGLVTRVLRTSGSRYYARAGGREYFQGASQGALTERRIALLRREHVLDLAEDDPDEALVQLLNMRDYDAATKVLVRSFLAAIEPSTKFIETVRRVPATDLAKHPVLASALLVTEMANPGTPVELLRPIHASLREAVARDFESGTASDRVVSLTTLVLAERLRGSGAETLRLSRELMTVIGQTHPEDLERIGASISLIYSVAALGALLNGDLALAQEGFEKTLESAERYGNLSEQTRGWSGLAIVAAMTGRFSLASMCVERAEEIVRSCGDPGPQLSWVNRMAALALIAMEQHDSYGMRAALERVAPMVLRTEQAPIFVFAEVRLTRATEGPLAALGVWRRAVDRLNSTFQTPPYMMAELAVLRANMLTYAGGYDASARALDRVPDTLHVARLAWARLWLFDGQHQRALEAAEAEVGRHSTPRLSNEAEVVAAVAAYELGDRAKACRYLIGVAAHSQQHGAGTNLSSVPFEPFLEVTSALADGEYPGFSETERIAVSELRDKLLAIPEAMRARRYERLSAAELRTLRVLAAHRGRADMAREMGVTENTVKYHLRSVYRKLEAGTRKEALARARALELVED